MAARQPTSSNASIEDEAVSSVVSSVADGKDNSGGKSTRSDNNCKSGNSGMEVDVIRGMGTKECVREDVDIGEVTSTSEYSRRGVTNGSGNCKEEEDEVDDFVDLVLPLNSAGNNRIHDTAPATQTSCNNGTGRELNPVLGVEPFTPTTNSTTTSITTITTSSINTPTTTLLTTPTTTSLTTPITTSTYTLATKSLIAPTTSSVFPKDAPTNNSTSNLLRPNKGANATPLTNSYSLDTPIHTPHAREAVAGEARSRTFRINSATRRKTQPITVEELTCANRLTMSIVKHLAFDVVYDCY